MPVESLLTFIFASALLSLAPGPDNLFVLTQSALYGRRSGLLITAGLCTGLIVHTTAVALGIAVIFQSSALAFTLLKSAGAAYLLYLAWQTWRSAGATLTPPRANVRSAAALYRRGILMNITNPKVSLFFLAFLPQFTTPHNGSVMLQSALLGGLFMLTAFIIFCAIALGSAVLSQWFATSHNARKILNRTAAGVLLVMAVRLATSRQN